MHILYTVGEYYGQLQKFAPSSFRKPSFWLRPVAGLGPWGNAPSQISPSPPKSVLPSALQEYWYHVILISWWACGPKLAFAVLSWLGIASVWPCCWCCWAASVASTSGKGRAVTSCCCAGAPEWSEVPWGASTNNISIQLCTLVTSSSLGAAQTASGGCLEAW